jgi:hypothetical protein
MKKSLPVGGVVQGADAVPNIDPGAFYPDPRPEDD